MARVVVLSVALGQKPPSDDTGAYCRARAKLSPKVIRRLTTETADACEQAVPRHWLWHGRHVKLVDGSTVSMPDTKANQQAYPQQAAQEKGLGFPIARIVVLLSLATGMLSDMAIGPYEGKETGEPALLRELMDRLGHGDIVLADRYYCSYFMVCLLMELGVDFVVRLHQKRTADFRRGRRLGKGDHVVVWKRPQRPAWMDRETYQRMPKTIEVREVHVKEVHLGDGRAALQDSGDGSPRGLDVPAGLQFDPQDDHGGGAPGGAQPSAIGLYGRDAKDRRRLRRAPAGG